MSAYSAGVQSYIDQGAAMLQAEAVQRAIMRCKKFDTIAVHGLYNMEAALANNGSIIEPAYFSTAQHFENSDHMEAGLAYLMPAWTYSRVANPSLHYLEETLALLEGYGFEGEVTACATGSGMAAVFLATNPFLVVESTGQPLNIVASVKCYGGTFTLFSRYANERGVEVRWVRDPLNLAEWAGKIDQNTRFLFGEMPANPSLAVFDIVALANLAHQHGLPFLVDSTIATPALTRPLAHGADIVIHSVSKSMTSSGFVIAGAIIARHNLPSRVGPDELRANFALYLKGFPLRDHGPSLSPFNALMTLSDLRTLRSRTDLMSKNAMQIAQFLAEHPQVESVQYPGLPNFEGHQIAGRYMWLVDSQDDYGSPVNRFGYLLSFNVKGGVSATRKVFDSLKMIWRATDLGRVKSVATIPTISTHQQLGDSGRDLAGLPPNLIRLSVGLEHPADVIADLDQALAASVRSS
jgi:O-acetylhomoserine/O-acetylserine sulfhydrylase-like pyridoxal-dependent enzyme